MTTTLLSQFIREVTDLLGCDFSGVYVMGCHEFIRYIPRVFNQVQERVMVTGVGTRRRRMSWTMAWCLSLPNSASHATSKTLTLVFLVGLNVKQVYPTFFAILEHMSSLAFMSTMFYAPWFLALIKL